MSGADASGAMLPFEDEACKNVSSAVPVPSHAPTWRFGAIGDFETSHGK